MINLIDEDKVFDKIQHPFIIKLSSRVDMNMEVLVIQLCLTLESHGL